MTTTDKIKRADPDHPIHELIATRWSPYIFDGRAIEREKLLACLEAARWAASSYNEQPWRFIIATRDDGAAFDRMVGCLLEANRGWAKQAGVLMITAVSRTFSRNGNPNRVAEHDLGLAVGNLTTQATAIGLAVHQMAGIELSQCRHAYDMPDQFDPVTAVAIGYAGEPVGGDEALGQRDQAVRSRKPLAEIVFTNKWAHPAV